jgi:DNA-binding beta-propeller fold protein YncE
LLSVVCVAAGPTEQPSKKDGPSDSPVVKPIALQPLQIVYRQVEGTYLKSPRGVSVDSGQNEVLVADTLNDLVAVYDATGLPLFAFGYNQELKEPLKAVPDSQGRIFVLNGIPRAVKVFSYRGEYMNDFPLVQNDPKTYPTAITIDHKGGIYVGVSTEIGAHIQIYDAALRLTGQVGRNPDGSSQLKSIEAITVDQNGNIYIADASATPCIQVYSSKGAFLHGWGAHDAGPQNFSLPAGLAIDTEGRVIVVDSLRHAITVFTKDGTYLGRYGGMGRQPGAVMAPADVAVNANNKVYIVERVGSRLQVLEEQVITSNSNRSSPAAAYSTREQLKRELGKFMGNLK